METRSFRPARKLGVMAGGVVLTAALGLSGCATGSVSYYRGSDPDVPTRTSANVITAEELRRYPPSVSVEDILQRHFPGIYLNRRHEPGGQTSVVILNNPTRPLYVIDGVPIEVTGPTLGLNPHDIQRIEVLKHGAAAMYGLRGAGGVILITTIASGN